MARKQKPTKTGLFHAREARHMSRTELVKRSGVSKQQLSRLENGQIRLRLDHLKPFANALGYTPEQMLLWGRYPGTGGHIESSDVLREEGAPRRAARPGARPGAGTRHPRRAWRRRRAGARSAQGRQARRPSKIRGLGCSRRASCASNCTPRRRGFWCSTPPATAWRRRSCRATASSSIPGTRPRRPTGFTPSATPSRASSSSACKWCARRDRAAGEDHFRQSEPCRPKKCRSASWRSSARCCAA